MVDRDTASDAVYYKGWFLNSLLGVYRRIHLALCPQWKANLCKRNLHHPPCLSLL
jgi:hypothetical protein